MKFITLSTHRSGSSLLQRYLDQHPQVHARQEDLRDARVIGDKKARERLDAIFAQERKYKAIGTKIQYSHMDGWIEKYVKDNNVKIIHLIRRNLLETVFWYPGNYSGKTVGGFGPDLEVPKGETITGYTVEVLASILRLRRLIEYYEKISNFTIYLDEIRGKADSERFYDPAVRRKLFDFLGVSTFDPPLPQKRADTDNLKKYVQNYEDIMRELKEEGVKHIYE